MTREQLKAICPAIKPANLIYADFITMSTEGWPLIAKCAFIAQIAHESGSFNYTREIASGEAYEGRVDLGNIRKGDGVKFKGRGLLQITGRSNYRACSKFIFGDERLLENPELLEKPEYAVKSAVWFWNDRKLTSVITQPQEWRKAFRGKQYDPFEWVTLRINGGQNGILERKMFFKRAIETLGSID